MNALLIFLNPKRFFEERRKKSFLWFLIPIYIILFISLFYYAKGIFGNGREIIIGIIIQILFNLVFFVFLSLFLKVFLKIFGVERNLLDSFEDGFLISLPSLILFILLLYTFRERIASYSYPLIYFFTYQKTSLILSKTLFFFYFPPRTLLFLYTLLGIRYIYSIGWKKSFLLTAIIYFIFFLTYIL